MTIEGWEDDEDESEPQSLAALEAANERSNAHIEAYLREYINDPNAPDHAVMISGAWGIGKSYFVRQMVRQYAKADDQERYVYVSLAGLQSLADMDEALAIAMQLTVASCSPSNCSRSLRYWSQSVSTFNDNSLACFRATNLSTGTRYSLKFLNWREPCTQISPERNAFFNSDSTHNS